MGGGHRLFRALLHLYPREFRRAYGDQMLQLHVDLRRHGRTRAWRRTVADLFTAVPTQRTEAVMNLSPTGRIVTLVLVAATATALVVGVGRGGTLVVLALLLVGLLFAVRSSLAGLRGVHGRGRRRAPVREVLTQAWWAPIAALLGGVTVVAGFGTIFDAHNLGGRIVGSTLLMGFGAATLYGLAHRPHAREGGNALVLLGTLPAFPFFWLVVPTVAAVVVWIGVLSSGFTDERPLLTGERAAPGRSPAG